ncbi:MAG: hypothetical protein M9936_16300 [Caldilinea sp.]|nr:hypothetical protein [Caldilinea sp.]
MIVALRVMAGGVQVTDVASGDGNGDEDGQYLSATAPGQASEAVRLRPEAPGDSSCALVSAVEAAPPAQGEAPGKARPAKAVVYHSQNYKQLLLIEVQALIDGASSAPDPLPALLESYGIDDAYLAACRAACAALDGAIADRRQAMADKVAAVARQALADATARRIYAGLRKVARTVLRTSPEQIALGLDEEASGDTALFLAGARHAVAAAQQEPYASRLAAATWNAERLALAGATLDALAAAMLARQEAEQVAIEATRARNAAAVKVRRCARQLRVAIELLLGQHPELSRPVWF